MKLKIVVFIPDGPLCDGCRFFSSGYFDEDPYYSSNPSCSLYNKTIADIEAGGSAWLDEEIRTSILKPDFCGGDIL